MATENWEDLHIPTDPEEQRRIHIEVLRRWLRQFPEAADEVVLRSMRHAFERRLGRALDAAEEAVLTQRLAALGSDRLGDVVIDLDAAALAAWLADPTAH